MEETLNACRRDDEERAPGPGRGPERRGDGGPEGAIMDKLGDLLGDDADAKAEALEGALAGIGRGWVRCSDRMPPLPEGRPRCYLVALEARTPDGAPVKVTVVALYSGKESQEGFAWTPAGKFYWGPDVFEDPVAWRELPICPFGAGGGSAEAKSPGSN